MFRIIELGPFDCRIDRGTADSLGDLPEGYEVRCVKDGPDAVMVYIEPIREKHSKGNDESA
jgi:hypothetical protein